MARGRTVYHVAPNSDVAGWVVSSENDSSFREEYDTKEEAVQAARARARNEEPSQVKVHREDGRLDYESTYGDDPRRSAD